MKENIDKLNFLKIKSSCSEICYQGNENTIYCPKENIEKLHFKQRIYIWNLEGAIEIH